MPPTEASPPRAPDGLEGIPSDETRHTCDVVRDPAIYQAKSDLFHPQTYVPASSISAHSQPSPFFFPSIASLPSRSTAKGGEFTLAAHFTESALTGAPPPPHYLPRPSTTYDSIRIRSQPAPRGIISTAVPISSFFSFCRRFHALAILLLQPV